MVTQNVDKQLYYTHYIDSPWSLPIQAGSTFTKKMNIENYTIELRDVRLYAHHGVMQQERSVGAWFIVDTRMSINNQECAYNDNITDTVSYADIYDIIKAEMQIPSNLLENVGKRIIETIFDKFHQIDYIETTICKETPPMGGDGLKACVTLKATR